MSAVGFASGLNASGRRGGSDPLGQLLTYKTNQDMLEVRKQQLAQQNEQFAKSLEFSNREHDLKLTELNDKRQRTRDEMRLKENELALKYKQFEQDKRLRDTEIEKAEHENTKNKLQVQELSRNIFLRNTAQFYVAAAETNQWEAFVQQINKSEFGQPLVDFTGGNIQPITNLSDTRIMQLMGINQEKLQEVKANPNRYVLIGTGQNEQIIPTEFLYAIGGFADHLTALELQRAQQVFNLDAVQQMAAGGDISQIMPRVAAINSVGSDSGSLDTIKALWNKEAKDQENEIKREQNLLKAIELAQKAANDSNKGRINTELANATSQQVLNYINSLVEGKKTDLAIVIGKTYLHNKYEALAKELGRDPTQQEVIASLDDTGGFIFNWLKQADKRFDELSKAQTTQSGILSNEVSTAVLSAAVNGMNKILDDKGSIFSKVREYFPSWESTLSNFNNMFGGKIFAGDENAAEDWKRATRDQAASFNFMVLYTKYVSGVAFREDEVDRINTIFSKFGDSMGKRATLIKDAIERQLNGLLAQKALDPLTFTLYRGDELVRLQTLYAMAQEWGKLAGIKDPKDREKAIRKSQKVLEPYYQTLKSLGYVVDIPERLDNTPTAKGVTPKVLPSSSTANLLKQQSKQGEGGTQTNKKNPADLLQPANEPPEANEYTEEQLNAIKWLD